MDFLVRRHFVSGRTSEKTFGNTKDASDDFERAQLQPQVIRCELIDQRTSHTREWVVSKPDIDPL